MEKIPFQVDISRVIEVLATQIYQTPLALLRENTQNSYDALLLRKQLGHAFEPEIEITISDTEIKVSDNGIGMTGGDLKTHYWRAGSSSKNTPEARAAGVVGTFGIGAMANFGIAEELEVVSESATTGERTRCHARRSTLSATEDCIEFESLATTGSAGTIVRAVTQSGKTINVPQAVAYISEFVMFLPMVVRVNGNIASRKSYSSIIPAIAQTWSESIAGADLGGGFQCEMVLAGSGSGELLVQCTNLSMGGQSLSGVLHLRQGMGNLRTFRSGFGLATTAVHSAYHFGGVADILVLQPTAGREALTTASTQLLQQWVSKVDDFVSIRFSSRPEADQNTQFMTWVTQRGRYDLCGLLKVSIQPGSSRTLNEVKALSATKPWLVYGGADQSTLSLASEDRPMIVLSRSNPRRQCEHSYLRSFCKIDEMTDDPKVLLPKKERDWSLSEQALSFRLSGILSSDYFVVAKIGFGKITHGLPILVTRRNDPIEIILDPEGQSVRLLISVYDSQYAAFDSMVKDFVRSVVFQKIADLVPSSTRQGAEAFLKSIQRSREMFEYELSDSDSLQSIWADYTSGEISMPEAVQKSIEATAKSVQVIDSAMSAHVRDVVPDVVENAATMNVAADVNATEFSAAPPIQRLEKLTDRKLLTITAAEAPLQGYRCFLAISDRIREDRGDFFLQPHKTSVVWGGQRALFIFEHHSGEFGLYYDIQSQEIIASGSGGKAFPTCTIILKNRIFIPVPAEIETAFIPAAGEKKKLQVKCDILYID